MSFKDILSDSYYIMQKGLLEMTRNRMELVLMIIMPLLLMLMFGFIYPDQTAQPEHLPVALIDLSHSGDSANFIAQLQSLSDNSVRMDFSIVGSIGEARQMINRNELYGAIIIPESFAADVAQGKSANVTVLYDNSNPQVGAQMLAEASGLISGVSGIKSTMMVSQLIAGTNMSAGVELLRLPGARPANDDRDDGGHDRHPGRHIQRT
jgi:ABC-2 type transport system permease protein